MSWFKFEWIVLSFDSPVTEAVKDINTLSKQSETWRLKANFYKLDRPINFFFANSQAS